MTIFAPLFLQALLISITNANGFSAAIAAKRHFALLEIGEHRVGGFDTHQDGLVRYPVDFAITMAITGKDSASRVCVKRKQVGEAT